MKDLLLGKKIVLFIILIIFLIVIILIIRIDKEKKGNTNDNLNTERINKIITTDELKVELEKLKKINKYSDNKEINPKSYPIVLGRYFENNLIIVERYFCADVCPEYGVVYLMYQDINSEEECNDVGGEPIIDEAFKIYRGCEPNIN